MTLRSVPTLLGNGSLIESRKKLLKSGNVVVMVRAIIFAFEAVHAVPAEGALLLPCELKPVHGLHVPGAGTVKPFPINT